jgi:hypothetical protein
MHEGGHETLALRKTCKILKYFRPFLTELLPPYHLGVVIRQSLVIHDLYWTSLPRALAFTLPGMTMAVTSQAPQSIPGIHT